MHPPSNMICRPGSPTAVKDAQDSDRSAILSAVVFSDPNDPRLAKATREAAKATLVEELTEEGGAGGVQVAQSLRGPPVQTRGASQAKLCEHARGPPRNVLLVERYRGPEAGRGVLGR